MDKWDKKSWCKIYHTINQWTPFKRNLSKSACTDIHAIPHPYELELEYEESKYKEIPVDDDPETELTDIILQFCALTTTTEHIATQYLEESQWSLCIAMNKFYLDNYDNNINDTSVDGAVYNHGIAFWYWSSEACTQSEKRLVHAKYTDLKEEILQFKQFTTNHWHALVNECNVLLNTDKVRQMSSNGNNVNLYQQPQGSSITCEHLCSIKLYTDYTWLCTIFCESFRRRKMAQNRYETIESVQCRNERVANWAKSLTESVQCYGTFMTGNMRHYRGIDMEFIFKRFITRFNVPLSTTTDFTRATQFSGDGRGLVLELEGYNEYILGLDCSAISSFDAEKEVLFFGSDSIFHIKSMYQWYQNTWTSYRKYMKQIQCVMCIANGSISWNHDNNIKEIVGYLLSALYPERQMIPPYLETLLNYRLKHVPPVIEYDFREIKQSYQWVQHILVKNGQMPNLSNACNLFKHCDHIRMLMGSDDTINMDTASSLIESMLDIENDNLIIEFYWKSSTDIHAAQLALQECARQSKLIHLETAIDNTTNSITVLPCIHYDFEPIAVENNGNIHDYIPNMELDGMLVRFFHIFAGIRDVLFIPQAIVKMVYDFVGCKTESISIESEQQKDFVKHLWENDTSEHQLQSVEDRVRAALSDPNISILFDIKTKLKVASGLNYVILVVTTTGLCLINANDILNYSIWKNFKEKTMIDKVIGDSKQIDETMAITMARNLNLIYDDVILKTKVVPRLIGLTKGRILSNIMFTKTLILSTLSLFGLSSGGNFYHNRGLVWMIYRAIIQKESNNINAYDLAPETIIETNPTSIEQKRINIGIHCKLYSTDDWKTVSAFVDEAMLKIALHFRKKDTCLLNFVNDMDFNAFVTLLKSL
eukprot:142329_1